jgi:acyl-coenzyme A thioesterase PaaI-like protein
MWVMAEAIDANLEAGIRQAFAKQGLMQSIGASLECVEAGRTTIRLPFSERITQHNEFVHAGIITAIVDNACGFAAITLARGGNRSADCGMDSGRPETVTPMYDSRQWPLNRTLNESAA